MKTKAPADPRHLRELRQSLERALRTHSEGLALNAQLRLAMLQCIHAGHWVSGDRIPTEAALVEATGMSLGTVQRALRDLTDEGVLQRRQGSGSFVASAPHRIDDVAHCRFLDDDGSVLPVFSRVLSRRAAGREGSWRAHFPSSTAVIRLDRVLNVNDEFDVFNRFYFDGDRFPSLASRPLDELAGANLKMLLVQEAAVPPGDVDQTMRLVKASGPIARHMGLSEGAWLAQFDIVRHVAGNGGSGGTFYYQEMFTPPTSRRLVAS